MTQPWALVIVALIATIVPLTTVILHRKVNELEHKVNSRLDELLTLTRSSAMAEGRLAGIEEQRLKDATKIGGA